MSEIATTALLAELKSLYPTDDNGVHNPWYCVAAVAFSASNVPEAIPIVFEYALNDLRAIGREDDALLLVHRMKDYIFKSGMLSGYPKEITATVVPTQNVDLSLGYQRHHRIAQRIT